jgi:hypothetical protein
MAPVRVGGTARAGVAVALGLGLFLILTGCEPADPNAANSTSTRSTPSKAVTPASGDADMVSAFSNRAAGQPGLVELKFKLTQRPAVGEPVDIQMELIPTVELERLFARFQVAEGLQIVSGAESDHFEHPARGVPVGHKMTVTARSDGIFYVTAVVLADSDKESVARTFSFPLIAGQGLLEQPAATSVAEPKQAAAHP